MINNASDLNANLVFYEWQYLRLVDLSQPTDLG